MKLTLKQEKFCIKYIETGNASAAYRHAYDTSRMNEASVNRKAKELMDNGKIAAMIAELRKPAVQAAQVTLEGHLSDLKRLRDRAEAEGKYGPAITAEMARGKASGFYVDRIERGKPGDFERMTDEELERRINENAESIRLAQDAIRTAATSAGVTKNE